MKKKIMMAVVVIAVASFQVASAVMIGADRLLGTIEPGTPASEADEVRMINGLLEGWGVVAGYNDGAASGTVMGDNPADPNEEKYTLKYTATTLIPSPASTLAVLPGNSRVGTGIATFTIDPGLTFDWVLAKWGQDSAVYYIAGLTGPVTLTLDGTGWESQGHGLSHYTLFNPHVVATPEGGMTLVLMGIGVFGLGVLKKRVA